MSTLTPPAVGPSEALPAGHPAGAPWREEAATMETSAVETPAAEGKPGLAMSSLVLGIIGTVLCFVPAIAWACGVIAIVHGARAKRFENRRGFAIAGFVLGIIAVSLGTLVFLAQVGHALNGVSG
jgi:hypothetical protein